MMQPAEQSETYDLEFWAAGDESVEEFDDMKVSEMPNLEGSDELVYLQRLVDDLKSKLDEAKEASKKERQRANRMEIASFISAEDWKLELEAVQKQYQLELFRLQKENKDLKHEVVEANEAKETALRMTRDAMLTSEHATKQMESLSIELNNAMAATVASRQETLSCMQVLEEIAKQRLDLSEAYAACQKSYQAGVASVAVKEAELKKQTTALFQAKQEAELLRWELFESRKSETSLCEVTNELETLKMQLLIARQTEEQQVKAIMDMEIELREVQNDVEQAMAAKTQVAALLASSEIELEVNRQKTIKADAEIVAMTASMDSTKDAFEIELRQMRMLQRENAVMEAKYLEASEKLADSLAREESKDEALIRLECSLEASIVESQLHRQQVYEAVFDAQFSEVETTQELMGIHLILKSAECTGLEVGLFEGPCLERDFDGLGISLPDAGGKNLVRDHHEPVDSNGPPVSLEIALAACKRSALSISLELKAMGTHLDRAREEADIVVESINESHENKESARQESLAQRSSVMEEALITAKSKSNQFHDIQETLWDGKMEVQYKFRDLSEPWEMVHSGSEPTVTIKKEEYDSLRLSIHEAMELQSLNESQLLSLRMSHQRLLAQLEAKNVEIKALRLSEQSMFQQYDQLQQQNIVLEAERRSFQGREDQLSKSWEVDANGLHCPRSMRFDKEHSIGRNLSSSEKEEEESSSEFLSLSSKKKKKALYLRIGTFLTKKVN